MFPTYLGARASHLDYLTQVPALHRIFDPDVIIGVVNEFLTADPSLVVAAQPAPHVSALGYRVLPALNGFRHRDVGPAVTAAGLEIEREILEPLVAAETKIRGARVVAKMLDWPARQARLPELLIGSIAIVVHKPASPSIP